MVAPRQQLSPSEYLAWERDQPTKHEYFHGDVFAMAGGSPRHNALCSNANRVLHDRVRPRGCYVFTSDQRVGVDRGQRYVYPDVSVVCGPPTVESGDVITNPSVVVEVLSRETEQNDRGSKWLSYQQLSTLSDYVLVTQWTARVEHFCRDSQGGWSYRIVGPGDRVVLSDGSELAVDEIFDGVMALPGDSEPPSKP